MKSIQIRDQSRLGLARVFRITAEGIRYRLFRASVTVAIIAVAVAFLMNILGESLIKRAVARDARVRIARAHLAHEWVSRLTSPGTPESILRDLAGSLPEGPACAEFARMGSLRPDETASLHAAARQAVRYLDFFARLDYARRRRLAQASEGIEILNRLAMPNGLENFAAALKHTRSVRFVDSPEELAAFVAGWPELLRGVSSILAGRGAAIDRVAEQMHGRRPLEALADAPHGFGDIVRDAGFSFDAETAALTADQAQLLLDTRRIERSLESRSVRQIVARHHDILPGDVNAALLWGFLSAPANAEEYLRTPGDTVPGEVALPPERIVLLAREWRTTMQLERAERLTVQMGGFSGLGERMAWLLLVSLLVCGIGITNAMLMTVTERFREIATLKCLGALDGVIMLMFVLESCLSGLVGGIAGSLLGGLLGTGRMLVAFGREFAGSIPFGQLVAGMGLAVLAGIVLAAIAAVYPAFRAARLAPMEAMRVE